MRGCILLIFSILCFAQNVLLGQRSDTLEKVEVRASAVEMEPVFSISDSLSTADDRWIFMAPISFVSGGLNDYAGISVRGANMSQTLVRWNGLSINSALSGIADVSMLKSGMMDRVELLSQGDGVRHGSQAVGGILDLENSIKSDSSALAGTVRLATASFGNYMGLLSLRRTGRTMRWEVKLNAGKGQNDYPFPYKKDFIWLNQRNLNGQIQHYGLMLNTVLQAKKSRHEWHAWLQRRHRMISPLNTNPQDSSYIQEGFVRLVNKNTYALGPDVLHIDLGFSHDRLDYGHPGYQIFSQNAFRLFQLDPEYQHRAWSFSGFAQYAWIPQRTTAHYLYHKWSAQRPWRIADRWRLHTGVAWVFFRQRNKPQFSTQLEYRLRNKQKLSAELNSVFRNPTLNELYFDPGGNPEIKAEEGWAAALNYHRDGERHSAQISIYHRDIRNWIFWYGALIFSPYNLAAVRSRGLEAIWRIQCWETKSSKSYISLNANLVKSTLEKNDDPKFDAVLGHQLPYTPPLVVNLNLQHSYRKWTIDMLNHYQSARFATLDSDWRLAPFLKSDLSVAYHVHGWGGGQFRWKLSCRNIWNSYYQYILNRPMPGRNYALELRFDF